MYIVVVFVAMLVEVMVEGVKVMVVVVVFLLILVEVVLELDNLINLDFSRGKMLSCLC